MRYVKNKFSHFNRFPIFCLFSLPFLCFCYCYSKNIVCGQNVYSSKKMQKNSYLRSSAFHPVQKKKLLPLSVTNSEAVARSGHFYLFYFFISEVWINDIAEGQRTYHCRLRNSRRINNTQMLGLYACMYSRCLGGTGLIFYFCRLGASRVWTSFWAMSGQPPLSLSF